MAARETTADGRGIERPPLISREVSPELYRVEEPRLSEADRRLAEALRSAVLEALASPAAGEVGPEALEAAFDPLWKARSDSRDSERRRRILDHLNRELLGYGPIDDPLRDPEVEDVTLDGVDAPVYVVHRRWGSIPTNIRFVSEAELDRFVVRLAERAGAHLSRFEPFADGRLPNGARLAATLGREISARGSSFAIRRFQERPWNLVDLLGSHTLSPEMAAYLWMAVLEGASTLIIGETGSGKTTTLNALLALAAPSSRVVTIEDTRELQFPHDHWVALAARSSLGPKDSSGRRSGEIDLYDLVRSALRQRPQILVVGEVRGRETFTLFQAMATGQPCHSTFHAESVASLVRRLESPPIQLPRGLLSALSIVVLQRSETIAGRRGRRIVGVTEIQGVDPVTREILATPIFSWSREDDRWSYRGRSTLLESWARSQGRPIDSLQGELARRARFLEALGAGGPLPNEEFIARIRRYGDAWPGAGQNTS